MISHTHKFIFVHINCCGGTSIERTLSKFGGIMRPPVEQSISSLHYASQHLTSAELKASVGDKIWRKYFKFAFIRNPWDRMVTYYLTHPKIYQKLSFKEFILFEGDFYDHDRMYNPCFDWLSDKEGSNLPLNYIGRFENLERDFAFICSQLNIQTELGHANKTKGKADYRTYYDKDTEQMLADKFKRDIDEFGYIF